MAYDMRKKVKERILKNLNNSKTKSVFKANIFLDVQVHLHAVTTQNFNNAINELVQEKEIVIDVNIIRLSNEKFLMQRILA